MKVIILTLCFFIAFLNFADAGEMYNCTDSDGNTTLTDIPKDGMQCVSMDSSISSSPKQQAGTKSSENLIPIPAYGDKTNFYTSPRGILYMPKGALVKFGHYLKVAFIAESKNTGELIRFVVDIDCNGSPGKIVSGDSVMEKGKPIPLKPDEIADRVKKMIGKYPIDRDAIDRLCELSYKYKDSR
jgi:hypothetical protein